MSEARRVVLWRALQWPGADWCELTGERTGERTGWRIAGTALATVADEPAIARYQIVLDSSWATREAEAVVRIGIEERERRLRLTADDERSWQIQREPPAEADAIPDHTEAWRGLVDIDLGFTPATNTLPIRRLAPAVGEAVDVTAVWVSFPELTIEPLPQRYTRLDEWRYRYESDGGAFVAEIEVDDLGLVVAYEGGWQRIAQASAAR
jgi:uncharacterized protein